jgi:hypothetical protein
VAAAMLVAALTILDQRRQTAADRLAVAQPHHRCVMPLIWMMIFRFNSDNYLNIIKWHFTIGVRCHFFANISVILQYLVSNSDRIV